MSLKGGLVVAVAGLVLSAACSQSPQGNPDGGSDAGNNPCGPGGTVMCGSLCVNTQSDAQNCGGCGMACAGELVCSHGQCVSVCGGGTSRCGSNCVDLLSDVQNC